ncbi:MAG TPA: MauE/DoxX family redox-associated membrane protein [Polyangia bacterium]|nr:MauE/DoxX family redox-associated membrane protein [Polyangia bacterium]
MKALALVLRLGLGGLLVVAGALKLRAPVAFATEIANYQLLPALAPYVAAVLPVVELVIGGALVVAPRAWRRAAALGAFALLATFTVAVGSAFFRRINIDCGCFGTGGGPITGLTLARNVVLMAAAATIVAFDERDRD